MKYELIKPFPGCTIKGMIYKDTIDVCGFAFNPADYPEFFQQVEEKPKTVWDLKEGDEYFYLWMYETPLIDYWFNSDFRTENRNFGNCFLTREEAERELEKRKLITKLLRSKHEMGLNKEFVEYERNYYIYLEDDELNMSYYEYINTLPILGYFSEPSQEYIDKNKEDLLRLFELTK